MYGPQVTPAPYLPLALLLTPAPISEADSGDPPSVAHTSTVLDNRLRSPHKLLTAGTRRCSVNRVACRVGKSSTGRSV
jgi:hypothetical protein